jgi:putative endonuclease
MRLKPPAGKELGKKAEELAAAFFSRKGYTILERNYRAPCGEIDFILVDRTSIVFAEIKARGSSRFGLPQEAVTPQKQHHILRTAQWYLQKKGWVDRDVRFDVLAISFSDAGAPQFVHIPWAFDASKERAT